MIRRLLPLALALKDKLTRVAVFNSQDASDPDLPNYAQIPVDTADSIEFRPTAKTLLESAIYIRSCRYFLQMRPAFPA